MFGVVSADVAGRSRRAHVASMPLVEVRGGSGQRREALSRIEEIGVGLCCIELNLAAWSEAVSISVQMVRASSVNAFAMHRWARA